MKKKLLTVALAVVIFALLAVTAFAYSTGDVNNSGDITAADARLALRYSASIQSLDEEQIAAADVDKSGEVTAADARKILRVSAGIDSFEPDDAIMNMLIEDGVLNVAVCADNPPFCYMENGKLTGVDIDVAEKIANSYGLELKLHNMAYDELVESVKNNKCDFVISKIENGQASEDYFAEQGLYRRMLKNLLLSNYLDFDSVFVSTEEMKKDSSKKIGVLKNSIADVIITNDVAGGELAENRIVRYLRYADAYNDLVNGKIYVFVDEKETLFDDNVNGNCEPYLNDDHIIFTTNEKSELLKKLAGEIWSTTLQQLIDSYCPPAVSDTTLTCEVSKITLAPGSTAVIEVSFDSFYGCDYLKVKSSPYNTNLVENDDKYYLVISIPSNATSDQVVIGLNAESSVTHTINVTVSKSSGAKYNFGTESYCPDLGAYSGVAPEEVVVDIENQGIGYIYDAEKLYNAGMKDTTDYEKYLKLLEKQGFVADSYMTDDSSYYMLCYINESLEEAVAYTEYYYYDGVYLYLTAVSVVVSHQF